MTSLLIIAAAITTLLAVFLWAFQGLLADRDPADHAPLAGEDTRSAPEALRSVPERDLYTPPSYDADEKAALAAGHTADFDAELARLMDERDRMGGAD